jgi:hypothetical protein
MNLYFLRNFNYERRIFVNKINKDNIYGVQYMQINCENYLKTRMNLYSYLWMNELYSYKPNTYSYREVNNNIQHILSFVHVWNNYNYTNQEVGLSY